MTRDCANQPSAQLHAVEASPWGTLHPIWGLWLKLSQVSKGLGNPAVPWLYARGKTEPRQMF